MAPLIQENTVEIIALSTLAGALLLLAKFWKEVLAAFKRINSWRRTCMAKKQQPFCYKECKISEIAPIVLQMREDQKRRDKSDLLRDMYSLFKAANDHIKEGYMSLEARKVYIMRLLDYLERNGNGPAQDISIIALRLPRYLGGPATEFELSDIYHVNKEVN